jgi:glycosyltransferase involved in cell wall biosynthesis
LKAIESFGKIYRSALARLDRERQLRLLGNAKLVDGNSYFRTRSDLGELRRDASQRHIGYGAKPGRNPRFLFDASFYLEQNPDVASTGANPLVHYLTHGARELRNPHPLFDTAFYIEQYPDVVAPGANPFAHFLAYGAKEGRNPHPLFDSAYYLAQNPGIAGAGVNPVDDYLMRGAEDGCSPHPLFDVEFYLEQCPDIAEAGVNPLVHYLTHGAKEGRNPHPLFDASFYLENNPDVVASGINPLVHYIACGGREGRDPHPLFHSGFYQEQNRDVAACGIDPLIHYLLYGAREGRDPNPAFDGLFYLREYPQSLKYVPLTHYVRWGAKDRLQPHPSFDPDYYVANYADVPSQGIAPLIHYLNYGVKQGRRANPQVVGYATSARLRCLKPLSIHPETALFVTYSPDGRIKPHVPHLLSALREQGVYPVLIVACDAPFQDADRYLLDLVEGLFIRENAGFDFAAFAHILCLYPELYSVDALYLINDSIVGPVTREGFADVMRRIRCADADVVGLTENIEGGWRLESCFLAFKSRALASSALCGFFGKLKILAEKQDVIEDYESRRMAGLLSAAGLRCKALFPVWREGAREELGASGFPFVKMESLLASPADPVSSSPAGDLLLPAYKFSGERDTIVVVVHEASRSGAAILGWNLVVEFQRRYNVVALLERGGLIEPAFYASAAAMVCLPDGFDFREDNLDPLVGQLMRLYAPKFVVANGVETRRLVTAFEKRGAPVIALIHDFSSCAKPADALCETASLIVFPARTVAEAAARECEVLQARGYNVLVQGLMKQPPVQTFPPDATDGAQLSLKDDADSMLVLGVGAIEFRKGVDLFISAAELVRRYLPNKRIKFAWAGVSPPNEAAYLAFLKERIQRSDLVDVFVFAGEVDDLLPLYRQADLMLLSSRLDSVPNAAIEAAFEKVPTICFDQASGFADILKTDPAVLDLVVPHLDIEAAARLICALVSEPDRLMGLSSAVLAFARKHFDFARYVDAIDALGCEAARRRFPAYEDEPATQVNPAA